MVKRARRNARPSELSLEQSLELLNGDFPDAFPDDQARREAWERHKEFLLQGFPAGKRPTGFYRYELHIQKPPRDPGEELAILLAAGLIDDVEARKMERDVMLYDPNQSASMAVNFGDPALIGHMGLSPGTLRDELAKFLAAAQFHVWRGRKGLSEKYLQLAEVVRGVLNAQPKGE